MRVPLVLLALLTLLTQSVPAQEAPSPAERSELCGQAGISIECARTIEARQIPLSHGWAQRDRLGLHLRLTSGKTITVVNDSMGSTPMWFYYFGRCSALGYYVLSAQWDEGSSMRLLNSTTGWTVLVDDIAAVSPDRRRFVTTSINLEHRSVERLQVWRIAGDTMQHEWGLEARTWLPGEVRWVSNRAFEFSHMRVELPAIERLVVDTATVDSAGRWTTRLGP
jgi:hypothetical protein